MYEEEQQKNASEDTMKKGCPIGPQGEEGPVGVVGEVGEVYKGPPGPLGPVCDVGYDPEASENQPPHKHVVVSYDPNMAYFVRQSYQLINGMLNFMEIKRHDDGNIMDMAVNDAVREKDKRIQDYQMQIHELIEKNNRTENNYKREVKDLIEEKIKLQKEQKASINKIQELIDTTHTADTSQRYIEDEYNAIKEDLEDFEKANEWLKKELDTTKEKLENKKTAYNNLQNSPNLSLIHI